MPDFDIGNLVDMARRVQEDMARANEQLAERTVEASSGGGMVTAVANGIREIVRITIDPKALELNDVGMLQDLIVAACNLALRKAQEMAREEMSKVAGGLPLPPGLF